MSQSGPAVATTPVRWTLGPADLAGAAADTAAAGPLDAVAPGLRRVRDAAGRVVATLAGGNPLAEDWPVPAAEAIEGDLILWSGTLGPDLSVAHPHTWMGPGRQRLAARVADLVPRVRAAGGRLLLRAHARQVLSDPPSVRAFLAERATEGFGEQVGLVLEPAALFEASMLGPEAPDHLERILAGLGDLTAVLLESDVRRPAAVAAPGDGGGEAGGAFDPTGPCPHLTAPGTGELPAADLQRLVDRWIDPAVPRLAWAGRVAGL